MAPLGDCDSIQTNLTESSGRRLVRASTSTTRAIKRKINRAAVMKLAVTRATALGWAPPTPTTQKQSIVQQGQWWKRQVA